MAVQSVSPDTPAAYGVQRMRGDDANFTGPEVRQILRLAHALQELPPDPAARKRVLLEGLCRLVRADAGVCVVSREEAAPPRRGTVRRSVAVSMVWHGMTEEDARAMAAQFPARARLRSFPARGTLDVVESVLDVKGVKVQARVALLRRRPGRRRFADHDRSVLDLLHAEFAWVYGPELPPLSPTGVPLSPRQRQTLQLLLAGNSEKEIGRELGLSKNRVHHHVKAIHRHFGVSSRSELLARWVRK